MIKKIYFYIFAFIQFLSSIAIFVNIEERAKDFLLEMQDVFSTYPENMAKAIGEVFTIDVCKSYLMFSAAILLLITIAFLILVIFNREYKKKGITICLLIGSILFGISDTCFVLSLLALGIVSATKKKDNLDGKDKVKKEKKSIQKLSPLKVDSKDIKLSILLIVIYLSQFILSEIPMSQALTIVGIISYYVILFALVIFIFSERFKRDFKALKDNLGLNIKYIFKMWGLMFLCSIGAVVIASLLGANDVSANQTGLNSMPILFVFILAVIWAPVVEESIFRGVIRRFIPNNDKLFIIVSAIVFGLIHTVGQEETLYLTFVQSLQYMAMGGVMAYTYTKTNNIFTNMGVHFLQNSFAVLMMLLTSLI